MTIGKIVSAVGLLCSISVAADFTEVGQFKDNRIEEVSFAGETPLIFGAGYINLLDRDDTSWGEITGLSVKPSGEKLVERETAITGESQTLIWDYSQTNGALNFVLIDNESITPFETISYHYKQEGGGNVTTKFDNIYGLKGSWGAGKFWVPAYQGGVVVVNPQLDPPAVELILPLDGALTPASSFVYVHNTDEAKRPRTVLYRNDSLFIASSDTLVRVFAIQTNEWSGVLLPQKNSRSFSIDFDQAGNLISYNSLLDANKKDSAFVLQRLGTAPKTIHNGEILRYSHDDNGNLYIQQSDSVTFTVYDASDNVTPIGSRISDALRKNSQFNFAQSIGFAISGNQFLLGANQGLMYYPEFDQGTGEFLTFRRDREITSGLKEVYAAPSIIANESGAIIEYSLSEDDKVTIDIFDTNLDFVCRIIDSEDRKAGGDKHSTNRARDRWDGSFNNDGGKTVAPGVYYFKIVAEKGGRAFGKVIVAKN